MAKITVGLGFFRAPDHVDQLKKAAAALPGDWDISLVGDPATHFFYVRVKRPTETDRSMTFTPDGIDGAIQLLHGLKSKLK